MSKHRSSAARDEGTVTGFRFGIHERCFDAYINTSNACKWGAEIEQLSAIGLFAQTQVTLMNRECRPCLVSMQLYALALIRPRSRVQRSFSARKKLYKLFDVG